MSRPIVHVSALCCAYQFVMLICTAAFSAKPMCFIQYATGSTSCSVSAPLLAGGACVQACSMTGLACLPRCEQCHPGCLGIQSNRHLRRCARPDKERFVGELVRVCAPGGRIIIVTWCHRCADAVVRELLAWYKQCWVSASLQSAYRLFCPWLAHGNKCFEPQNRSSIRHTGLCCPSHEVAPVPQEPASGRGRPLGRRAGAAGSHMRGILPARVVLH